MRKKAKVTKAMDEENEAYEKLVVPLVLELIVVLVIPGNEFPVFVAQIVPSPFSDRGGFSVGAQECIHNAQWS